MQGVVIQSYGAGNGPTARADLMSLFREASRRGTLILNITQCQRGVVSTSYATGQVSYVGGYKCALNSCHVSVRHKAKAKDISGVTGRRRYSRVGHDARSGADEVGVRARPGGLFP